MLRVGDSRDSMQAPPPLNNMHASAPITPIIVQMTGPPRHITPISAAIMNPRIHMTLIRAT